MTITSLAMVIGFVILLICIVDAYRWNKLPPSLDRFFLLEGKLKLKGFVSTILAANLSLGNFLIFIATWGYLYGTGGLIWFAINLVLNVVGFRLFFPRCRDYIESHSNNGTIHDYLATAYATGLNDRIAAAIRLCASLVTVVGLLFAIVFELSLAVALLQPETQLRRIAIFSCLAILICIVTAYGGFKSLVTSDICQASLLTVATIILVGVMFSHGGVAATGSLLFHLRLQDFNIGWANIISICVIGSGWLLVAMDQWQRTCASRSYDTSRRGVSIYLVIITIFAVVYALWGVYDRSVLLPALSGSAKAMHSGGANPLADMLLLSSTGASAFLVNLIACGLLAAGLSTTNTFLTVCSHSMTTDVLLVSLSGRSIQNLSASENRVFMGIGRGMILSLGAAVILAFAALTTWGYLTDPLTFFFIAYSIQFALLAPMVMSWPNKQRRPSSAAALVSIVLGLIVALSGGFGFWILVQRNSSPILKVTPGDWLTLTPVVTFVVGLIPLAVSFVAKGLNRHESRSATA